MKGTGPPDRASSAVLTVPNLLSFLRILLIPVFVVLIVHEPHDDRGAHPVRHRGRDRLGRRLVARRTGQVSELGKVLDPTPTGSRSPPA